MAVVDGSILRKDVSALMISDMQFEGVVYDLQTLEFGLLFEWMDGWMVYVCYWPRHLDCVGRG
jgi:hypothetical protein